MTGSKATIVEVETNAQNLLEEAALKRGSFSWSQLVTAAVESCARHLIKEHLDSEAERMSADPGIREELSLINKDCSGGLLEGEEIEFDPAWTDLLRRH
ncbi:MAG: hypothetical protein HRF49_01935 [bacterium]|jgi:hypothetical protein